MRYFRQEDLAERFQQAIDNLQLSEEILEWLKEAIRESTKEHEEYISSELHRLRIEYTKCERNKEKIYKDRLEGRFREEFLETQFNTLEVRQEEIIENKKKLEGQKLHSLEENEKILELIKSLGNQYFRSNFEVKAKMLKIMLSNSVITNEKCLFSYRKSFDDLANFAKMEVGSATGIRTPV